MTRQQKNARPSTLGWIPLALGAWAVIFGAYELMERGLLQGADLRTLHLLHILRGTLTSFVLAALVAWYIIRRGIFEEEPGAAEYFKTLALGEEAHNELEKRLLWLIRLRWVAIVGVLLTMAFATLVVPLLSSYAVLALGLIVALMVLYNIGFGVAITAVQAPKALAFAQVLLDLIALTLMLHFSGGIENPFFAFFVFHVIIASILLRKRESYLVAALTCVLFSSLVVLEHTGLIRHYSLGLLLGSGGEGLSASAPPYSLLYTGGILTAFVATTLFSVYFATTIMEDLRQRQQDLVAAGELLAQEKAKLDDIVSSIGAGLMVCNGDHHILWSNPKVQEWFGPLREGERSPLWCQQPRDCPMEEALETGRTSSCQRTLSLGGAPHHFIVTFSPIRDARGKATHALGLIQEITRMKEMEIQLVQAGKMVAVGQLASGIAHEINNPLATVAASAELLGDLAQGETLQALKEFEPFPRHLKRIEEHVYRCKEIIQSLLGFVRKEEVGLSAVRVEDVLEETLKLLGPRALADPRRIVWDRGELLPLVWANPRQLQQVFTNLLLNALDALDGEGTVTVRSFRQNGVVTVEVADTGAGIRPEHLSRIFDPFFTTKPPGRGTGLGLYLCHQILESLGGKISVTSHPGEGSTFSVALPAVR
ncbi:MAG: PAS domain-containing protein [Candidatus Tectomicrobia bacterium]|uniref:histidine kinase n=1 Tax=Tectimicrobiota bacterium TaxID=2528274 RepID=A0A932G1V1_UNCTE|nr:PAS domain-containing protein [Candidatus Tectomicrobia bacterium]